jgi:hypothetical protein
MANPPINTFNIGQDLRNPMLVLANGVTIPLALLGHVEEINAKHNHTPKTVIPVTGGGMPIERNIYHGWSGEVSFTRLNGGITGLIAGIVAQFQNGNGETYFALTGSVANGFLGTSDPFSFLNCVINDPDFGSFGSASEVKQKFGFRAQSLNFNGPSAAILTAGVTSINQP